MSNTAPSPPRPRRLSGADSFWLRMDHPTNLMMINGVMLFDEPLDPDRVRQVLRERVLPAPRFCERIVFGAGGVPRWEPCRELDLDRHLVVERLPQPAGEAELAELIGRKMSEPLDFAHPLWRFHIVENLAGGSALIGRFHHCLGDGIGLMMVLLAMTDLPPDDDEELNPFLEFVQGKGKIASAAHRRMEQIMPEGMKLLTKPLEAFESLDPLRKTAASIVALCRLTFRSADSKTLLNARLGVPKVAAWSPATPVKTVKQICDGLGGTLNDVLLTAVAGGIRRYLAGRDGEAGCKDFRATVPVSMRPLEQLADMGNEFGLVYLTLPIEIADPRERLAELRRRMRKLKRSAEPLVSLRVLSLMGRLPWIAQRALVRIFASKATAVVTNVPGPNQTLHFAGSPVRDMLFWVPRSARLSLGISVLSYAGRVRVGFATDAGLVPDPEAMVDGYQAELEAMRRFALDSDDAIFEPSPQETGHGPTADR